jgi:hypothetical protein
MPKLLASGGKLFQAEEAACIAYAFFHKIRIWLIKAEISVVATEIIP